jgi:hypothetical protein
MKKKRSNMEMIILNDGMYHLVPVTKAVLADILLVAKVTCLDLCDILRIKLSTYYEPPMNSHVMNDGSGNFFGCICK